MGERDRASSSASATWTSRDSAKSKYAYTIAVIIRDELKDPEGAIDKFNEALDLDHTQLKAFEAINKILTQKKDWKNLERAYRKMLHRIVGKGNTELEFSLWHTLGIIYRDRMKQFESAAEAFRMASNLQPDNQMEHQILAELFSIDPEPSRRRDRRAPVAAQAGPVQGRFVPRALQAVLRRARLRQGVVPGGDALLPQEGGRRSSSSSSSSTSRAG